MCKIYVMADIHGAWQPVRDFIKRLGNDFCERDTLIILGDAGLNYFFNKRDDEVKAKLNSFNMNIFVIRGNHEQRPTIVAKNNEDWLLDVFFGNLVWVERKYPNIKYAADCVAKYDLNGYKTLVVPGAYSVDKYYRLQQGWSWFEDEQLTAWEMDAGRRLIAEEGNDKWEVVLSHTCPISYEPTDLFIPTVDQSLVDKTTERYLEEIERQIDYKLWLFGHYHRFRTYPKIDDKFMMMLWHDYALDLTEYIDNGKIRLV